MTPGALQTIAVSASVSFVVAAATTPLVGRMASALGVVAKPRADRWAGRPVPMLGGVAIFMALLGGVLVGAPDLPTPAVALILGGFFLLVVGALDDRFAFRPQTKLLAQVLGGCVVTGFGVGFQVRPVEFFNVIVSLFWIVAVINAINLMDNMDGLAPGVSLVAAAFIACQLAQGGLLGQAALAAALAGGLAGFLLFNFPPARIFMGDAGSLSVGLLLGGLSLSNALVAEKKLGALSVLLGPALVMAVPILDVVLVSVTRTLRGQPISQGGRDHSSHRLIMMGLSERKALLVFYALAGVSGLVGLQLAQGASLLKSVILVPLSWIPLALFFAWLARVRVVADGEVAQGRIAAVVGWMFKRRMAEVVMDVALAFAAFCLAYAFRFDFNIEPVYRSQIAVSAPWVVGLTLAALQGAGVYGGHWEHYGIRDIFRFAKAVLASVLACIAVAVVLYRFEAFPRSVFPLYGGILFVALLGVRSSFHLFDIMLDERVSRRVLIFGTGVEALTAYSNITAKDGKGAVAGFVDSADGRGISKLHGLPVYHLEDLERLNGRCSYDRLVLADASPTGPAACAAREMALRQGKAVQRFDVQWTDL